MSVLIDIANEVSNSLQNKDNGKLLAGRIEGCISEEKSILIEVLTPLINLRNTIYVENYEINEDDFYLDTGWFELHINLDTTAHIVYNNDVEEYFTITNKDTELNLYFV